MVLYLGRKCDVSSVQTLCVGLKKRSSLIILAIPAWISLAELDNESETKFQEPIYILYIYIYIY